MKLADKERLIQDTIKEVYLGGECHRKLPFMVTFNTMCLLEELQGIIAKQIIKEGKHERSEN